MEQEHILVIDDEEGLLQLVKMRLTAMGFAVTACTSGRDAVTAAKTNRFDLAITDLRLRGEDGLDVTEELLRIHPGLPVIILTAAAIWASANVRPFSITILCASRCAKAPPEASRANRIATTTLASHAACAS